MTYTTSKKLYHLRKPKKYHVVITPRTFDRLEQSHHVQSNSVKLNRPMK